MVWLKFLHIVGATVWLGGGSTLILVGIRARRSSDPNALREFARVVPYVGMRLLGRAWTVVLITGVWMALVSAAWQVSHLWWLLALGLFAIAFLLAAVNISRESTQLPLLVASSQAANRVARQ